MDRAGGGARGVRAGPDADADADAPSPYRDFVGGHGRAGASPPPDHQQQRPPADWPRSGFSPVERRVRAGPDAHAHTAEPYRDLVGGHGRAGASPPPDRQQQQQRPPAEWPVSGFAPAEDRAGGAMARRRRDL